MALYFQKEQEDSLRKEFRKIDLAIGVKMTSDIAEVESV
jgi:hypothetical protein